MGQKLIGRHKEGDLQQQGHGAPQGVGGGIIVLPVIGLEHHHPLVAGEGLFDVGHAVVKPGLRDPGLLLHGVGPAVEGKHQHVHGQAQEDDGKPRVTDDPVGKVEDQLKQELQRPQENGAEDGEKCHDNASSFPVSRS